MNIGVPYSIQLSVLAHKPSQKLLFEADRIFGQIFQFIDELFRNNKTLIVASLDDIGCVLVLLQRRC